jgi:hypothetical protein
MLCPLFHLIHEKQQSGSISWALIIILITGHVVIDNLHNINLQIVQGDTTST